MNKLISMLALLVIILPISVNLLFNGPNNLLDVCTRFFERLFEQVVRFGTG